MSTELKNYRVRVLFSGSSVEKNVSNLSWDDARKLFEFYVSCCLEFPDVLSVRCVNIFKNGKQKSIRLFQNY